MHIIIMIERCPSTIWRRTAAPLIGIVLLTLPMAAAAHPEGFSRPGFGDGLVHPLLGLDHLIVAMAVGVVSGIHGGRARWLWPLAFAGAVIAGFPLTALGAAPFLAEATIIASLLLLGGVLFAAVRIAPVIGAICMALFGLGHGAAHGIGIVDIEGAFAFGAGLVLATGALHCLGLWLGRMAPTSLSPIPVRIAGIGMLAVGLGQSIGLAQF